ncbi:acyl-CoA carboxylase subunit epsilon [Rhodococcus triatomae]|nr:acyl-CoA carboxylase subunit epsilon [Rhodococcus triatomae]QNG25847.1 acyl-CoA carboxylase subunit epsilon [Rhodococcus triatomae]
MADTDSAPAPTEGTDPVDATADAPQIRIVKGAPTDADVAAIVAVLAAAAATSVPVVEAARPPETWGEPTRLHRGAAPFSPYSFPHAHRF